MWKSMRRRAKRLQLWVVEGVFQAWKLWGFDVKFCFVPVGLRRELWKDSSENLWRRGLIWAPACFTSAMSFVSPALYDSVPPQQSLKIHLLQCRPCYFHFVLYWTPIVLFIPLYLFNTADFMHENMWHTHIKSAKNTKHIKQFEFCTSALMLCDSMLILFSYLWCNEPFESRTSNDVLWAWSFSNESQCYKTRMSSSSLATLLLSRNVTAKAEEESWSAVSTRKSTVSSKNDLCK